LELQLIREQHELFQPEGLPLAGTSPSAMMHFGLLLF
jgi:hypothetical protein